MTEPPATSPTNSELSAPLAPDGTGVGTAAVTEPGNGQHSRTLGLVLFLILLVVGVALLIGFFGALRHWLALHTGTLHGGPDLYYNFWSGFGSDLGEATLISAVSIGVYTGVRKVNCHTKGCWRIGHHPLDGTPYILCRHHHPDVPTKGASHQHILEQHRKYKEAKEAREATSS
jgi:hypothetical protein